MEYKIVEKSGVGNPQSLQFFLPKMPDSFLGHGAFKRAFVPHGLNDQIYGANAGEIVLSENQILSVLRID